MLVVSVFLCLPLSIHERASPSASLGASERREKEATGGGSGGSRSFDGGGGGAKSRRRCHHRRRRPGILHPSPEGPAWTGWIGAPQRRRRRRRRTFRFNDSDQNGPPNRRLLEARTTIARFTGVSLLGGGPVAARGENLRVRHDSSELPAATALAATATAVAEITAAFNGVLRPRVSLRWPGDFGAGHAG